MKLPNGTLTFLFSDIEGSTQLWEHEAEAMRSALAQHDSHLSQAIESAGGQIVKSTGDGFHAVFAEASQSVAAALTMQQCCINMNWATSSPIRIRIGLHTGESQRRDGDYYGPAVNRAARLMAAAHGGQIVCSTTTADLARENLVEGARLVDLGEHRLRDLARAERVFQIEHGDLPRDFPPLRSIDTLPGNLPVQPNRFIGRHELISSLTEQLRVGSMVTIVGTGGAGKTRLALQVAAALQPDFEDGAWFVDLSTVRHEQQVCAEILATLNLLVAEDEDPVDGLCKRLRRRRLLLVLDNCEQVVSEVARVAHALSTTETSTRVLATSREALGIAAEQLLPIPPMETSIDGDAVRLFIARAKAVRPNFSLNDGNRDAVLQLCSQLDGIPLAIELAAARIRSLAPAQILERLDQRFRILKSGGRIAAARHQTLQAAVDWSYELLSAEEQTVLNRLAIFAGGFTLDAAESVVSDDTVDAFAVLDHLDTLVDKSLVVAEDMAQGRRYRLLETIRQYTAERLEHSGEVDTLRASHSHYFQEFTQAQSSALKNNEAPAAMDRLDTELDNLRAMLDWQLAQDRADSVTTLLADLRDFILWRDHNAWAIAYLDKCLKTELFDRNRALALTIRVEYKVNYGQPALDDVDTARRLFSQDGLPEPLLLTHTEGSVAATQGNMDHACLCTDKLIAAARAAEDRYWLAQAQCLSLMYRSLATPTDSKLPARAEQLRGVIAPLWEIPRLRDAYLLAAALAYSSSNPTQALRFLAEQQRLGTQQRSRYATGTAEFFSGLIHLHRGEPWLVVPHWRNALLQSHDVGNRRGIFLCLSGITGLGLMTGSADAGLAITTGLRRARQDSGFYGSQNERDAEARIAQRYERELGQGALDRAEAPDVEVTIDLALKLLDSIAREPKYKADKSAASSEEGSL